MPQTPNYTLYHGDCLEILPALPAQSVDAIICDPPYGTTACKWDSVIPFEPMWAQLKRIIKPRGAIVLFGSQPFTSALVMSNPKWFKYEWMWRKSKPVGHLNAKKRPMLAHESICVFYSRLETYNPQGTHETYAVIKRTNNGAYRECSKTTAQTMTGYPCTDLIFPHDISVGHPTQKPVALMEYLIRTYTHEGETVLDFTMGSGTTGVAALNTGRRFIGIERDEGYCNIAVQRLNAAQQQPIQQELAA